MNCPSGEANAVANCSEREFHCSDQVNCVYSSWVCDGFDDCSDGSDEANCTLTTCQPNQFRCDDGKCIPLHLQCSGEAECADSSDETKCKNIDECAVLGTS